VSRQQNVSISFAEKVSLRMLRCDVFGAETENGVFSERYSVHVDRRVLHVEILMLHGRH
jgi:hypothetical protein